MKRGSKLSAAEKAQIEVLRRNNEDWPVGAIARAIKRSPQVVTAYLNNPETYGTKKHTGRPRKTEERDDRKIVHLAREEKMNVREIAGDESLCISKSTVYRRLIEDPFTKFGQHRS